MIGGAAVAKTPGPDMTVILTPYKTVYQAGETPFLRVQLQNWSSNMIFLPGYRFACNLASLKITDANGNAVPSRGPRLITIGVVRRYHIPPHTLFDLDDFVNDTRTVWNPISDWGYELKTPGVYTLSLQFNFPAEMAKNDGLPRGPVRVANPPPLVITIQ